LGDRLLPHGARIGHDPPVARRAIAGPREAEAWRRRSGLHAGDVDLCHRVLRVCGIGQESTSDH
jgi:hypothetical protein